MSLHVADRQVHRWDLILNTEMMEMEAEQFPPTRTVKA
jgi:hypothetical protein